MASFMCKPPAYALQCHPLTQPGNVTVQGTVSGQLTVAADQNIYISGNVAYNNDPRTDPSSTDMLGLVANQNITVIEASAMANNGNLHWKCLLSWWPYKDHFKWIMVGLHGKLYHCGHGPIRQFDQLCLRSNR